MTLRWPKFRSWSLRARMLLIIVGSLCLAQVLYLFLSEAQLHASFKNHMIDRAIRKFVLQAEALMADPGIALPAKTASSLAQESTAWVAPDSLFRDSWQTPDRGIEQRVQAALDKAGVSYDAVQASYGVRPRTAEEIASRHQSFGVWALPADTFIALRLSGHEDWLNAQIRSRPPPPPVTTDALLLNLAVVVGVGTLGVALVVFQINQSCRDLGNAAAKVGLAAQGDVSPVRGPSEFHAPIQALNASNRRIAELLVEKDVMLGAIGHDLRTPLTSLRLAVDGMEPETKRLRAIAAIEETAELLDDILELARSGKSDIPGTKYDLSALVADMVADELEQGHDVTLDCDSRVVAVYRPASIRRLLQNLIGNAVKYAGSARVALSKSDGEVRLLVEDDGPGIPADDLETLLQPFRRGETSRNRNTGGAGLGLTISRAIARAHGGDLRLANRQPHGLRVEVTFPD